jgi:hypothetical protein
MFFIFVPSNKKYSIINTRHLFMKQFFTSIFLLLFTATVLAQAPQAINYQGVARNASGVPYAGQQINVRVSIHTETPNGSIEYSETRSVTTNQFGLFNVQIGSLGASAIQGNFTTINWAAGSKFLQTEISVNGQPFTNLGTTQMMSVPFSLHSNESKDLIFPFSKSIGTSGNMLSLTNDNTSNSSNTIKSTAVGGRAFHGSATTGVGGFFLSNSGTGIYSESNSGTAIWGESPNGNGIMGITNNVSGIGVTAINNVNGIALAVDGNVRINGGNTNPGIGKVLTSDANGNATWQAFSSGFGNFKLPIDTTVNISNVPVFRIKNISPFSSITIMGESVNSPGIYGSSEKKTGILGNTSGKNESGISGVAFADSAYGVSGKVNNSFKDGVAVFGDGGSNNHGLRGKSVNKAAIQGFSDKNYGVYGESKDFIAVQGISNQMAGVSGESTNGVGVAGLSYQGNGAIYGGAGVYTSKNQFGVMGEAFGLSTGVLAKSHGDDAKALVVEGKIKITGTGTNAGKGKVLTSDETGNATWEYPQTIAFRASSLRNDADQVVPSGTEKKVMFFQQARYNVGAAYDAENSIFFPPVAGVYHFNTQVDWYGLAPFCRISLKMLRNGQITTIAEKYVGPGEGSSVYHSPALTLDIALQPSDAVWVVIYHSNQNAVSRNLQPLGYSAWFAGHLVTRL